MVNAYVEKIQAGLAGAVIGDAFGAPTETLTTRRIREEFGWLEEFRAPDLSPFASGRAKGAFTDDSSQIVMLVEEIIKAGGLDLDVAVKMLLAWSEHEELARFTGPSTRGALERIKKGEDPSEVGKGTVHAGTGVTNGGAMKVAPAGWLAPGDIQGAVNNAAIICAPTHNTQLGVAGGAAIAAGVAVAMVEGATLDEVLDACREGARLGEEKGLEVGREAAGPSIVKRIDLAIDLARKADSFEQAVDDIAGVIGAGLAIVEAVPCAVGLLAAAGGDVRKTAIACANVGDDTDTVGTMATAIAGTLNGMNGIPADWYELVSTVNEVDFESLAKELAKVLPGA